MKHKVIWEPNTAKYSNGFGAAFQPYVSRGEPSLWEASLILPGIQMKGTTEAAMARVDNAVISRFAFLEDGDDQR